MIIWLVVDEIALLRYIVKKIIIYVKCCANTICLFVYRFGIFGIYFLLPYMMLK